MSGNAGPVTARPRAGRGRTILRTAVPAALIAAAFGLALPRVASYRDVWTSIEAMTWPYALMIGTAAAASMVSYWITIRTVLPWIGLRQAAAVSLGSNAVASTLPAGGAVAVGVSWAMLSSWGLSTADFVLYTLVTGIWNIFTLTGLPFLAVLVMATASQPDATMITGAAVGLALLAAVAGGLALLLHSEASAFRADRVLQYGLSIVARLTRRAPPARATGSLPGFRDRASTLLAARGWRIAAATVASHLMLWLVLLACLRAVRLSQAQLPWQTSLAAFAVIRLLTVMPITPGGLGITEFGLIGILAGGADHEASAQITAAVLMYRAVTYLPSIPLGALAYLTWRYAPAFISTVRRQRRLRPARPVSRPPGCCHDSQDSAPTSSPAPSLSAHGAVDPGGLATAAPGWATLPDAPLAGRPDAAMLDDLLGEEDPQRITCSACRRSPRIGANCRHASRRSCSCASTVV